MRLLIAISLVFLLTVLACEPSRVSIKQTTPKDAVKGFLDALQAEDFDLVAQYVSESSKASLQDFKTNIKMISAEEKKNLLEAYKMPVEQINCQEEQGNMRCLLTSTSDEEGILHLVQQDGKWFVQIEFSY